MDLNVLIEKIDDLAKKKVFRGQNRLPKAE